MYASVVNIRNSFINDVVFTWSTVIVIFKMRRYWMYQTASIYFILSELCLILEVEKYFSLLCGYFSTSVQHMCLKSTKSLLHRGKIGCLYKASIVIDLAH